MGLSLLSCGIAGGMPSDGIFGAIKSGSAESVQTILNKDKTNLKVRNKNGCALLIFAIGNGKEDIAELLIKNGADLEAKSSYEYKTPLSAAIAANNRHLAEFLIEKGAKVSPDGLTATTPLREAVKKSMETKQRDILKILLDAGADLNDRLRYGNTVLHRAVIERDLDLLKFLFENSKAEIDLEQVGWSGTLLTAAARNFDIDTARFLIEKGAKVNVHFDAAGVLHHALYGAKEMITSLLEKGADASAADWKGKTLDDLRAEIDNMLKSLKGSEEDKK